MTDYNQYLQWIPTVAAFILLGGVLWVTVFAFMLIRGFSRLKYLKDISESLKKIEKHLSKSNP